ncbi:hypothetical protein VTH82DRAFT_440 [Thermothelomyces myriococcoides]
MEITEAEKVDVLICGSGSAGLCAAVWLARYGVGYRILERRDGPLRIGQADGVQTRTVEIFDSFGVAEDLLREAYHVLEVAFWGPDPNSPGEIVRTRYAADKETAISHQPHVILNQARLNQLMTGLLGPEPPVEYGCEVKEVRVDDRAAIEDPDAYAVTVTAVKNGTERIYRAKYVLGCDGAHSTVRRSLGFKMVGDSTDAVWGVMDVYPRTDFPDIRKKCVISSAAGSILIVPREGDELVRFYTELPLGTRAADVTLEGLQAHARRVFGARYPVDFAETAWWSAYAIGQRLADGFHRAHRVFLAGDACHTHSPKAGQGMNVSLQDGYNAGWKLAMVLRRLARPDSLLPTYVLERERTAADLIDFDRSFARLFDSRYRSEHGLSAREVADHFVRAGRYTAGQAVHYDPSVITDAGEGPDADTSRAASGLTVGMVFRSAQVVRFCDAKAMQLVKGMPANGQWYIVVFAGDLAMPVSAARLKEVTLSLERIAHRFTPLGADPDSVIDRILVLASDRKTVEQDEIPVFFTPVKGKRAMKCLTKVFSDEESYNSGHGHAYELYGVDPERGALVVVRPDHYVAKITTLDKANTLEQFFERSRGCQCSHKWADVRLWRETYGRIPCDHGQACRYLDNDNCLWFHPPEHREDVRRRRAERLAAVFRGLEERETVAVGSLKVPAGRVTVTDVQELASFNKISDGEIAVPGAPPKLHPLTEPLRLRTWSKVNRSGSREGGGSNNSYDDIDDDDEDEEPPYPQYTHIFEPLLRSIELMRPGFDLAREADVVSSATNLRKLFDLVQNRNWAAERFDIEVRGRTMLLARWVDDPNLALDLGCGMRFERTTCRHGPDRDPVLRRSASHHLVVAYTFGGLRCVVQGEVDAYHCDHDHEHDHDNDNDHNNYYSPFSSSQSPSPPLSVSTSPSPNEKPKAGVSGVIRRAKRGSDPLLLPPKHHHHHHHHQQQQQLGQQRRSSAAHRSLSFTALTLDDPGDSGSSIAMVDRHPAAPAAPAAAPTTRVSPTLLVHHAGRAVPAECLVEVKTRGGRAAGPTSDEAQLYFARRRQLYLARHERGLFRPSRPSGLPGGSSSGDGGSEGRGGEGGGGGRGRGRGRGGGRGGPPPSSPSPPPPPPPPPPAVMMVQDMGPALARWEGESQATLGRLAALLARLRQTAAELGSRGVRGLSLVCQSDGSGLAQGVKVRLCERVREGYSYHGEGGSSNSGVDRGEDDRGGGGAWRREGIVVATALI